MKESMNFLTDSRFQIKQILIILDFKSNQIPREIFNLFSSPRHARRYLSKKTQLFFPQKKEEKKEILSDKKYKQWKDDDLLSIKIAFCVLN